MFFSTYILNVASKFEQKVTTIGLSLNHIYLADSYSFNWQVLHRFVKKAGVVYLQHGLGIFGMQTAYLVSSIEFSGGTKTTLS